MMKDDPLEVIQEVAYFLQGMAMDPAIPAHARDAAQGRADELFAYVEERT
jgi:hypothetical protein